MSIILFQLSQHVKYINYKNLMGGSQSDISNIGTNKGEGYRIINVRPNSPLQKHVDLFFDFIIDAAPLKQPERTTKEILNKLTDENDKKPAKTIKKLQQIFAENQNSTVVLRIVSTKYRNVKTVQVTPNRNWDGHQDLIGITTRLQRYDEAFQTYFPFADIRQNSPIKKTGIKQGEFLIGCKQFKFNSVNELMENLYDRFYDKLIEDKNINFAVYNLATDELRIVPVLLGRGWGEKGLLGCQFLEGHLNKFPKNLLEVRSTLIMQKRKSEDNSKIKKQLSDCNGASVQLIESIKNQKNKKKKNVRNLKNLLLIQPSKAPIIEPIKKKQQPSKESIQQAPSQLNQYVPMARFKNLQNRVATLEEMMSNIKQYINDLPESDEDQ